MKKIWHEFKKGKQWSKYSALKWHRCVHIQMIHTNAFKLKQIII